MKHNSKRAAAFALAAAMCMPMSAMAAPQEGTFATDFDIYSPALHVSVPLEMNIQVNPFNDTTGTGVDKFTVASEDINIINASVDEEKDIGIPVNVTVTATATGSQDVQSEFTTFTADATSTKKRVYLELTEAAAGTVAVKTGGAAAFEGTTKLVDLSQYEVAAGDYSSVSNSAPITSYGSLLSVDIAKPGLDTGKTSYIAAAADVKPTVGTFAVTGVANTHADWKKDDVKVAVAYKITPSNALAIKTPAVAEKTAVAAGADVTFDLTKTDIGDATVAGIAFHDPEGRYPDYLCEEDEYTAVKDTGDTKTTVTLKKDGAGLAFVTGADSGCKGSRQDLVVALSDGRRVVVSLKLAQ